MQASNIETLADAWKKGDTAAVERLLHDGFRTHPPIAE